MKIINTFVYDNNENVLRHDCTIIAHGKAFDCDVHRHFSLYAYLALKVEKRASYKYVEYSENAWLLLRLRNYATSLVDKESNCKY